MTNSSKSHFLIIPYETTSIQIPNSCIKASSSEEPLGIKIDNNLTFHDHIISLRSRANKKLSALSRVSKYMGINKRCILMKYYIFSQFNYVSYSGCAIVEITEYRKEHYELCIETISQASKNFFKKINLSLSTRKSYSTLR